MATRQGTPRSPGCWPSWWADFFCSVFAARLGVLVRLLSAPVLTGYLAGSGIVIAISQLPKLTGISTDKRYPSVLGGLVRSAETVEPWAVAIGLATAVFVVVVAQVARHIPAGLAALALATVFVAWAGLADTIDVVGHVQGGLPRPAFPDVSGGSLPSLLGPAGSIALLVFASSILTAQALAARDGAEIRPNREFLALGGANLVAGLFQGFPANGSDSRSFVVADSGGRCQLTGLVGAVLLVITLVALTPLFRDLPSSALAAVVLVTALKLIDVSELRRLWRVRTSDFTLALVTLAGVLSLGVLNGIVVGVVASLLEVLRRAVMPHTAVLGRLGGPIRAYRDVQTYEDAETIPGLLVYRFDAPLFFANADVFRNQILRLVDEAEKPVRTVVVNAEAIYDVDTTGIRMLERLQGDLEACPFDWYSHGSRQRLASSCNSQGSRIASRPPTSFSVWRMRPRTTSRGWPSPRRRPATARARVRALPLRRRPPWPSHERERGRR
jgi:SulP family sulfate permease